MKKSRALCKCTLILATIYFSLTNINAALITGYGKTNINNSYGTVYVNHSATYNTGTNNRWTSKVTGTACSTMGASVTTSTSNKVDSSDGHRVTVSISARVWYPSGSNSSKTGYAHYYYNGKTVNQVD